MTVFPGLVHSGRLREIKERCHGLTSAICDYIHAGKKIGIRVNENNTLTISRFGSENETETVAIGDRVVLATIRDACLLEVDRLQALNGAFSKICGKLMYAVPPNKPFDALHESFWV